MEVAGFELLCKSQIKKNAFATLVKNNNNKPVFPHAVNQKRSIAYSYSFLDHSLKKHNRLI